MARDPERQAAIQGALRETGLDGLVCALPANVLLLTGYWPVVGSGVVVVARDGPVVALVPEDERELAEAGGADKVRTFRPFTLDAVGSTARAIHPHLSDLARDLSLAHKRIGYEGHESHEPLSYAAMHLYGAGMVELLQRTFDGPTLRPADDLLGRLHSRKTARELEGIRRACRIVAQGFLAGAEQLRPGLRETEAAALVRAPLSAEGVGPERADRAGGFVYCMSGPNAAKAHGAYARSRARALQLGDLVLVHCNSFADGFWTDVTRTYGLGGGDERRRSIHEVVLAARAAALGEIKAGVKAADVDRAAREVLRERGYGKEFKHSTGHGVGFRAINPDDRPRLHPASPDVLEEGMVFNVEPAVYVEGYGGVRHCDVVALTAAGAEMLTPFQGDMAELIKR